MNQQDLDAIKTRAALHAWRIKKAQASDMSDRISLALTFVNTSPSVSEDLFALIAEVERLQKELRVGKEEATQTSP